MEGWPTGAVAASTDSDLIDQVQKLYSNEYMRIYRSEDVVGVEVGGALKNVYAIAAGSLEGLGLGMNSTALLCTR